MSKPKDYYKDEFDNFQEVEEETEDLIDGYEDDEQDYSEEESDELLDDEFDNELFDEEEFDGELDEDELYARETTYEYESDDE